MISKDLKITKLQKLLKNYRKVIVAFSGGIDSTFLLKICTDVLGTKKVIAATAVSDSFTERELHYAKSMAKSFGVEHTLLQTNELSDRNYILNTPKRCYYCKKHLFSELLKIAAVKKIEYILDASNTDDMVDYRPGRLAAREFSIESPLIEAGITKKDIRKYSKMLGLTSWDIPANPCLASRIPYGSKITKEKLRMVGEAEEFLKNEGFTGIRVRHHGRIARIELSPADFAKITREELRIRIVGYYKKLNFHWITLDLEGYRMGSLNEILPNLEQPQTEKIIRD